LLCQPCGLKSDTYFFNMCNFFFKIKGAARVRPPRKSHVSTMLQHPGAVTEPLTGSHSSRSWLGRATPPVANDRTSLKCLRGPEHKTNCTHKVASDGRYLRPPAIAEPSSEARIRP